VADGVVQCTLGGVEGLAEFGLLLADAGGLAFHVLGVPPAPLLRGLAGGVPVALLGQADRAAHPLGQLGELVPRGLCLVQPR
jgi:hypothetical protein